MKPLSLFTLIVTTGILLSMLGFLFIRYENIVAFKPRLPGRLLRIATPIIIGILPGLLFIAVSSALSQSTDPGVQILVANLQYSAILSGLIGFLSGLLSQPYIDPKDRSILTSRSLDNRPWKRCLLGFISGAVYGFVLSGLFGFPLNEALSNASTAAPTGALAALLWPILTRRLQWRKKDFEVFPQLLRAILIGFCLGSIFGLIEALLYKSPTDNNLTFWMAPLVRCGLQGFTSSTCTLKQFAPYLHYTITYLWTFTLVGTTTGLLWEAARILTARYRLAVHKYCPRRIRHIISGALFGLAYALTIYTLVVDFSTSFSPRISLFLWPPIFILLVALGGYLGYARYARLRRKKFPAPDAPSIFAARNSFIFHITVRASLREYLFWAVLNGVYTTATVAASLLFITGSETQPINPLSIGLINAMIVAPIGTLVAGISYYCIWKAGRVDGRNAALIGITLTLLGFGLQLIRPIYDYLVSLFS